MKISRLHGFTLTELLVTITIIGVLGSLLLPTIGKMRDKANSAKCLGNLRQISVAMISYCGDNEGRIPAQLTTEGGQPRTWRLRLLPYLNDDKSMKVFLCPSDKVGLQSISPPADMNYIAVTGVMPCSYGLAVVWYHLSSSSLPHSADGGFTGEYRIGGLTNPAATIFLTDTGKPDNVSLPPDEWTESTRTWRSQFKESVMPSVYYSGGWTAYPRHGGGRINAAFFDGHAETVTLQALRDNPPGNPNSLYWPYR